MNHGDIKIRLEGFCENRSCGKPKAKDIRFLSEDKENLAVEFSIECNYFNPATDKKKLIELKCSLVEIAKTHYYMSVKKEIDGEISMVNDNQYENELVAFDELLFLADSTMKKLNKEYGV